MGGDELLRSVARFQREMLRKREEEEVKLLAKEPKSLEEKGNISFIFKAFKLSLNVYSMTF